MDKTRPDDSEIIDAAEEAPGQGGRSGGRLARDIGTQDAIEHGIEGQSITRVRGENKPEGGDRPTLPKRD